MSISGDEFTHEKCLNKLNELGAVIIAEHNVYESFSGDGLIVASFNSQDSHINVEVSRAKPWESLFGTWVGESLKELKMRRDEVVLLNEIASARTKDAAALNELLADRIANSNQSAIDAQNRMIILGKANQNLEARVLKLLTVEQQLATIRSYKIFKILSFLKRMSRKLIGRS